MSIASTRWSLRSSFKSMRTTTLLLSKQTVEISSKLSKIRQKRDDGDFFLITEGCGFAELPFPMNIVVAIAHSVFVKGDQTDFEIEESFGVEASELYPDVKYATVEQYLDQFV
ncbi:Isoflavone reductase-like protein [Nymphaea thermarum]|nr:Isoflavone reductase-like protein [Nymphaea thermarum]